eukprot:4950221-Ditylum_brightwellii.AAC.1
MGLGNWVMPKGDSILAVGLRMMQTAVAFGGIPVEHGISVCRPTVGRHCTATPVCCCTGGGGAA